MELSFDRYKDMRQESLRSTESATDGSYRWPAKLQYNPFTEEQRTMNEP